MHFILYGLAWWLIPDLYAKTRHRNLQKLISGRCPQHEGRCNFNKLNFTE